MNIYASFIKILAYAFIVLGIAIIYIIRRRRYNRKTFAGLPEFSSFEAAWITRLVEFIFKLIALALILGGLGMIILLNRY